MDDFLAQLDLGLGKLHFQQEDYRGAEQQFRMVCESFPKTAAAPEACYWAGVAAYKGTNDPSHLAAAGKTLREKYADSEWARKASVWGSSAA